MNNWLMPSGWVCLCGTQVLLTKGGIFQGVIFVDAEKLDCSW